MESQVKLNNDRLELLDRLKQVAPDLVDAEWQFLNTVYRDGALSSKMKRLIALGIALRAGCTNCILAQTKQALDVGASSGEILEVIAVEMAMSGTTGVAESLRVVKLLDELGKL
ncbi:MAG: carboxymuconolactone decarboxylase family protein [Dehalococcoidales bacterium]|jgi:AhpD family alkylhydroperoxidase|nr:carboxymuconolactone decarboxylase family protein [Dehalococcoidales bacterium]